MKQKLLRVYLAFFALGILWGWLAERIWYRFLSYARYWGWIGFLFVCYASSGADALTDPSGQVWEPGTNGWFFWTGFSVGCGFYLFGIVKRMAVKSGSKTPEF